MILHKTNVFETSIVRFYCSPEVYLFLVVAVTCSPAEFAYNLRGCMLIDFTLILHNIQHFCFESSKGFMCRHAENNFGNSCVHQRYVHIGYIWYSVITGPQPVEFNILTMKSKQKTKYIHCSD